MEKEEQPANLIDQLETTREEVVKRSSTGVVTVDGQKYAVGLVWQPVQNLDDPIVEIRESADSETGADLYCLRPAATPQYGMGYSDLGHRDGMPSLAAAVASVLTEYSSVCAVFRVDEGWWLIAIRNDLILAEEDIVFATEVEAQKAYASMMAVPDWGIRIVPPEWNIEGVQQEDLTKLVHGTRKVRLQSINAQKRTKFLLAIALLIVLGLGYLIWMLIQVLSEVFTDDTDVIRKPTGTTGIGVQAPPPTATHKPWEVLPDMKQFFDRCWDTAYQVRSVIVPGWTMGTIQCTPGEVMTNWRLSDPKLGRLSWMRYGVNEYQLNPNFKIDIKSDGTSATGMVTFDTKLSTVSSEPKMTPIELEEDIREIQQATGLSFQFNRQTLLDPPNRADGTRPPNQKTYTYYSFVVLSPYAPMEWLSFFEKFSGLEITKLEYTPSGDATNKWKYEGRIYAK